MVNAEKQVALDILKSSSLSPSKFGLRFDRVVVAVLADLRSFVENAAPTQTAVLLTMSAPIRLPAATATDLKPRLAALLATRPPQGDTATLLHGNELRIRLVGHASAAPVKFIGFVHNPAASPERLLDLAEEWLRAQI